MNKKSKIALGFLIFGGTLTVSGLPLFLTAGIGTKAINYSVNSEQVNIRSGYFYYGSNFEKIKSSSTDFTETVAKDNKYSYDFYGFAKYMVKKINDNNLPQPQLPNFVNVSSIDDVKSFYNEAVLNYALFITGAVLWPVGMTTLFISLPIFISFKRKGK